MDQKFDHKIDPICTIFTYKKNRRVVVILTWSGVFCNNDEGGRLTHGPTAESWPVGDHLTTALDVHIELEGTHRHRRLGVAHRQAVQAYLSRLVEDLDGTVVIVDKARTVVKTRGCRYHN